MDDPAQIAIVGAGEDGCRLARTASLAGVSVRVYHADPAALDAAQERVRVAVDAALREGRIGPADRQRALDGILFTLDLDEAVTHAALVIDSESQPLAERRHLFMRLGESCRASTVLAATAGSPNDLIDWVPQPGRVIGLHVPERGSARDRARVVAGVETSLDAIQLGQRFAARLGLEPVVTSAPLPGGDA